eukprot:1378113-Amorphochlora_amoeboformis.AAC.2
MILINCPDFTTGPNKRPAGLNEGLGFSSDMGNNITKFQKWSCCEKGGPGRPVRKSQCRDWGSSVGWAHMSLSSFLLLLFQKKSFGLGGDGYQMTEVPPVARKLGKKKRRNGKEKRGY